MKIGHDTFKTQVAVLKTTFGLTDAEVAAVATDNTDVHAKIAALDSAKTMQHNATQNKKISRKTTEDHVRGMVRQLKAHANYTEALGQQLGISGPEDSTDLNAAKPALKLDAERSLIRDVKPHRVTISFNKSVSDGVNLYSRRGGETAFTFLARDTESPYIDTRPNLVNAPEPREYKAFYVWHDEEVGHDSDVVQTVVARSEATSAQGGRAPELLLPPPFACPELVEG